MSVLSSFASFNRSPRKVVGTVASVALFFGMLTATGVLTAHAEELLGPEPTGMSPASGCPGTVVTFTGHEFYPSMTAIFGSSSTNVYGIFIPISDNDTAQATVPSIPAGTYTVTLSDRYGQGTVPGTFTVPECIAPGGGWWNIKAQQGTVMKFSPPLHLQGKPTSDVVTGSFALDKPYDIQVLNTSAKAQLSLTLPSTSCSSLIDGSSTASTSMSVAWQPSSIEPSDASFTGFAASTGTTGTSLSFSGPGTSVTGSYQGQNDDGTSDNGASSTMTFGSPMTSAEITKACASEAGLKSLTISNATISFE